MTQEVERRPRGGLAAMCITRTTSWGLLYYSLPVAVVPIEEDTGWSAAAITAAFSAGLIVSAVVGIWVGRRRWARWRRRQDPFSPDCWVAIRRWRWPWRPWRPLGCSPLRGPSQILVVLDLPVDAAHWTGKQHTADRMISSSLVLSGHGILGNQCKGLTHCWDHSDTNDDAF